jgi:multiple sugar transport system substrate-binding protein
VKDKVGAIILPGTKEVLDRKSGKLVACDANTCPHAINGVNHAPYAAFGGWSGAINKNAPAKVKDAGYAFLSYMSQPAQANVDVTIGKTGFNPYRISQFENIDLWVKAGMSEAAARNYLGAIKDSLNSPNMVLDLRIPGAQRYQGVVLDTVLSRYLAGELTTKQAMEELTKGWNEITDELGREKQKQAYRSSLSIR